MWKHLVSQWNSEPRKRSSCLGGRSGQNGTSQRDQCLRGIRTFSTLKRAVSNADCVKILQVLLLVTCIYLFHVYVWEPAYVKTYMFSSKDNIQPWESGFLLPDLRRKVAFFQHLGPGVRTGLSFFVGSMFTWNAVSRIFSVISFTQFFWPTNLGCQRLLSNVPRTFPSFIHPCM